MTGVDEQFDNVTIGGTVTAPSGCNPNVAYGNTDIGVDVPSNSEFTLTEEIASQLPDKTLVLGKFCR